MNASRWRLRLRRASSAISLIALAMIPALPLRGQDAPDTTKHTVQFVSVEENVKLEVLDWGGSGQPMIFLAGMGDTAHVFDKFAPIFTAKHHVYGITRRGFGASSKPVPGNGNYMSDRLGDDVLAVMNQLKIDRPILVGHSMAGEELSSIGSRFPGKVAGLIYLEAGYGSAYYDSSHGDMVVDMNDLKERIDQLESGKVQDEKQFLLDLANSVSSFQKSLDEGNKRMQSLHSPPPVRLSLQRFLMVLKSTQRSQCPSWRSSRYLVIGTGSILPPEPPGSLLISPIRQHRQMRLRLVYQRLASFGCQMRIMTFSSRTKLMFSVR